MPQDAFSQMKDDLKAVRRDVPGFSEVSGYSYIFVVFCEPVINPAADVPGGAVGGEQRDQSLCIGERADGDRIRLFDLRFARTGENKGRTTGRGRWKFRNECEENVKVSPAS